MLACTKMNKICWCTWNICASSNFFSHTMNKNSFCFLALCPLHFAPSIGHTSNTYWEKYLSTLKNFWVLGHPYSFLRTLCLHLMISSVEGLSVSQRFGEEAKIVFFSLQIYSTFQWLFFCWQLLTHITSPRGSCVTGVNAAKYVLDHTCPPDRWPL